MTCAQALQEMLQADLSQLAGEGGTALARHIRDCGRCREAAQAIRAGEAELAMAMTALVPQPDFDALIDEVREGTDAISLHGDDSSRQRRIPTKPSAPGFRIAGRTLLPLALAAGLGAILLTRSPPLPGEPFDPSTPAVAEGLDVEAPAGRNVAVLETEDPDIIVLWLF